VARLILIASVAWVAVLATAQVRAASARQGDTWIGGVVYTAASYICHQRQERSFSTAGMQWPVCARCSGLYLAAPIGALIAVGSRRRPSLSKLRLALAAAAVPTVLTLALEWPHLVAVTNVARFAAALPLGAAIAYALTYVLTSRAAPALPSGA
jgi:uncharacterized membrane protein